MFAFNPIQLFWYPNKKSNKQKKVSNKLTPCTLHWRFFLNSALWHSHIFQSCHYLRFANPTRSLIFNPHRRRAIIQISSRGIARSQTHFLFAFDFLQRISNLLNYLFSCCLVAFSLNLFNDEFVNQVGF